MSKGSESRGGERKYKGQIFPCGKLVRKKILTTVKVVYKWKEICKSKLRHRIF